jgi:hypothetical protein
MLDGGGGRWNYKQIQWQKASKVKSLGPKVMDYWLSSDPNHMAADLNFDSKINFFDYAIFTKDYM